MKFKKLETKRIESTCYLCEKNQRLTISDSNLIMLNTPAAFQTILDDPENEKEIMLTWTFSDLDGNVVLLCDDCSGYVFGMLAKQFMEGVIEKNIGIPE